MQSIAGQPVLTAAAMRAAENAAMAGGTDVDTLMARAGAGVAEWVARLAGGREVLVLCGPGNNGGDGYIAAREMAAAGVQVRVAASAPPATDVAMRARAGWSGAVDDVMAASPAPVVVDALFGTGLSRPLAPALAARLAMLVEEAMLAIAVDLPSGLATDDGQPLAEPLPVFHLTLALGALKPAHLLQPGARHCGTVRLVDLALGPLMDAVRVVAPPALVRPDADAHKYSRGMVTVVAGAMPGAAALAAEAALRAGAGYALLLSDEAPGTAAPHAIVRRPWRDGGDLATGKAATAIVIGPGLGRDASATLKLSEAIDSEQPLVIDGDALRLIDGDHRTAIARRRAPVVMTPHGGEFQALFGDWRGSKIEAARAAANGVGATMVFKGADTVIAHPDGRARLALPGNPWLSTAGTGDVLAGTIAAMLASGMADPAEAGVWLHGEAAWRLGAAFIADDLVQAIGAVRGVLG